MRSLFMETGLKKSPDDSWYLQVIFTDSEYQGKGNIFLRFAYELGTKLNPGCAENQSLQLRPRSQGTECYHSFDMLFR